VAGETEDIGGVLMVSVSMPPLPHAASAVAVRFSASF
jgi:hypothetical protein